MFSISIIKGTNLLFSTVQLQKELGFQDYFSQGLLVYFYISSKQACLKIKVEQKIFFEFYVGEVVKGKSALYKEQYEASKNNGTIPQFQIEQVKVTYWWRYLLIMLMMVMGTSFLVFVDRETVEIHKEYSLLVLGKMNPWLCCRKKSMIRDLEKLIDIQIVKRGHQSYQNSTIYYALEFIYDETAYCKREEIMEFNDIKEAKKKYVEITTFINKSVDLGNIGVADESTCYKKKEAKKPQSQQKTTTFENDEKEDLLRKRV